MQDSGRITLFDVPAVILVGLVLFFGCIGAEDPPVLRRFTGAPHDKGSRTYPPSYNLRMPWPIWSLPVRSSSKRIGVLHTVDVSELPLCSC